MENVKVVLHKHGYGKVYIDGAEISGVVDLSVSTSVGGRNLVRLTVLCKEIEIELEEADVETRKMNIKKQETLHPGHVV